MPDTGKEKNFILAYTLTFIQCRCPASSAALLHKDTLSVILNNYCNKLIVSQLLPCCEQRQGDSKQYCTERMELILRVDHAGTRAVVLG